MVLALLLVSPARAEVSCDFTNDVRALETAKDTSLASYSLAKELDLRKKILEGVITCMREEGMRTKENVHKDAFSHNNAQKIAETLKERISFAIGYLDQRKENVRNLGIQGTKDVAREVKEWRVTTLLPLIAQEQNVLLFEKALTLYDIADERGKDLGAALRTLSLESDDRTRIPYEEALKKLRKGRESLNTTTHSLERLEDPAAIAASLKNALDTLSSSYESFFKVREALKEILSL